MESETISLGQLSPDRCHSCSHNHTCGLSDSPLASSPRRVAAPVPVEEACVQVYEIDKDLHKKNFNRVHNGTVNPYFSGHNTQINFLKTRK